MLKIKRLDVRIKRESEDQSGFGEPGDTADGEVYKTRHSLFDSIVQRGPRFE